MRITSLITTFAIIFAAALFAGCDQDSPVDPAAVTTLPDVDWDKCHQPPAPLAEPIIVSATLHLWVLQANGASVDLHRITAAWAESTTTWNTFGGAFAPEVEGSFLADGTGWRTVDVTALVEGWATGAYENFGLLIDQPDTATPFAKYRSRESARDHPWLEVCYRTAGGAVCDSTETVADTYIWGERPDVVQGDATELYSGWKLPSTLEKHSLLGFDLSFLPKDAGCAPCSGQLTELSLRYLGANAASIEVYRGKSAHHGRRLFAGTVEPGATFSFAGDTRRGTVGSRISVFVNGHRNARFVTNCSLPIGPGSVQGDFEVVAGTSRFGGPLCAADSQVELPWCNLGKPRALIVRYNGESCDATEHSMEHDAVTCEGDPQLAPRVHIIAADRRNANHRQAKIWFDGEVALDETFVIDAGRAGENRLTASTHILVYDLAGNLLQRVAFQTSCSQPLAAGDQFGSLVLEDYTPW